VNSAQIRKWSIRSVGLLGIAVVAVFLWQKYGGNDVADTLASGNGRIEAVEIDVSPKMPGRVKDILAREGDFVTAGQVVARMDAEVLEAQLRETEAQMRQAESAVATARSQLAQREAEKAAQLAVLAQREAELDIARKRYARSSVLAKEGASSQQEADDDSASVKGAEAAVGAVRAQIAAADAAIATARSQVVGAESAVEAAKASIQRIRADIEDSILRSPRDGRVQYRVAQLGEVLPAGGVVLNLVDLSDVYMTFFLPTREAGRVALGAEARLTLDALPGRVIPARVSFVADVAQFTPKTVETAEERQKLMFRVKANIDPDLLRKYLSQVKTGLPGMAYVRLDPSTPWPPELAVNVGP
jgi:HlyD family secretion protein